MKRGFRRADLKFLAVILVLLAMGADCAPLEAASGRPAGANLSSATQIQVDWEKTNGNGPDYYGVEYTWVDQDRDLFLERYRLLKPNLLRVQITQEYIEPANDNADPQLSQINFNLTLPLDTQSGKTLTHRDLFTSLGAEFPEMHFHLNIWLAARWNAANPDGYLGLGGAFPPLNSAEHGEFVRELARWLVETCEIAPDRLSFSFVNEPNLKSFFTGNQADLITMAQVTRAALDQVSPQIQMMGLDEVHGAGWTDSFYPNRPAGCCDAWTYHAYERGIGSLWSAMQTRAGHLSTYGPVWVTEFADTANGSPDAGMNFSTPQAALGFARVLGRLWSSGIDGLVHFRLSDTYTDMEPLNGWAGHGLFADWRGTKSNGKPYAIYPAFWVFANFYNEMAGGQVSGVAAPPDLEVAAARHQEPQHPCLVLWVTNPTQNAYSTQVEVTNFPLPEASVEILDNLAGNAPIGGQTSGMVTSQIANRFAHSINLQLPANSSYTVKWFEPARGSCSATPEGDPSMNRRLFLPLTFGIRD